MFMMSFFHCGGATSSPLPPSQRAGGWPPPLPPPHFRHPCQNPKAPADYGFKSTKDQQNAKKKLVKLKKHASNVIIFFDEQIQFL